MGFLLPSGPNIRTEGPRLDSLQVTDSAYGNDIPIPFGTVRLGGNVIWATELREEKVSETVETGGKGGGGGGSQTTVTYLYYSSFAVSFGEGVARDVLRIWADGKLIYNQKAGSTSGTKDGVNFRFYPGSEDQLPDSAIVADKGAATPAHRGLCYIVFDDLPLKDFGNRIPSITAEINFESRQDEVISTETQATGTPSVRGNSITVDWARDRLYLEAQDESEIAVFSLSTLTRIQSLPFYNIAGVVRSSGNIVARDLSTTPDTDVLLNPFTGGVVKSTQREVPLSSPVSYAPATEYFAGGGVGLSLATQYGTFKSFVSRATVGGIPEFRFFDLDDLSYLGTLTAPDNTYNHITLADTSAANGLALGGFWNSSELMIYRFQVGVDVGTFGGLSAKLDTTLLGTITPSMIDPDATSFSLSGGTAVYTALDETSASLIFGIGTNVGTYLVRVNLDGSIEWTVKVPFVRVNTTAESDTRVSGGAWAYHNGSAIVRVNIATGTLDPELDGTQAISGLGYDGTFFDDNRNAIYNLNSATSATEFRRHTLGGRAGKNVRVADIIDRVSERVGVQPVSDSDVSQLTAEVEGYVIDGRMTAKKALEPLAALYFFDLVERDGKLVYQNRGESEVVTIPEDDFIRTSKSRAEQYVEKRIQESELPSVFNVNYIDSANDYQENTAGVRRILAPDNTVRSDNSDEIDIPASITATTAKQTAERLLYTKWLERSTYETRLPQKYLYLDPADACTFDLNNGFSFRGRLDEFDIGKDFSAKTQIVRENAGQYVSTVTGDGGGVPVQEIPIISPTQAFFLDIPLLRDIDALQGTAHRAYFAGNNYGQGGWPGCVVSKSSDGSSWATVLQQLAGVPWGITTTTLGNPESYWRTDEVNTVDVIMVDGEDNLESITDLELVNGGNPALLLKSNGEIGLIQFRDVTALGDGKYRLSGLLRGRRGTDTMDRGYAGGEFFLFIGNPSSLAGFSLSLDERSQSRFYKPVTIGQLFEAAITETFTHTGRDAMPYAPVAPTAVVSGSDLVLGWTRRTRLGGESDLADGGDGTVPLAEVSERYDILIRDSDGDTVRTVTDHTSTTYTYSQVNRLADGVRTRYGLTVQQAENGLSAWTDVTGVLRLHSGLTTPSWSPYDLTDAFGGWGGTVGGDAYQDVTLPTAREAEVDTGNCTVRFRAYQACFDAATNNDPGGLRIECLDATDSVLGTINSTVEARGDIDAWELVTAEGTVPANTRKFRLHLLGTYVTGSNTDAYFDNLVLDLFTTEMPSTISFDVYQKSGTVGRGFVGDFDDVEVTT